MAERSSSRTPPRPIRKAGQQSFPDKNDRIYMEESIIVVIHSRYPGMERIRLLGIKVHFAKWLKKNKKKNPAF